MMVPYIHTNDGVSFVIKGRPYHVSSQEPHYEEALKLIDSNAHYTELEDLLTRTARRLQQAALLTPDMQYSGGVIKYRGEVLANYAADRLVQLIEGGHDYQPLARFLDKLQANPSKRVVDCLYEFLEKGAIPLTEDGDFLAYKAVRSDYRDIYSGRFDNRIGAVAQMPRNKVDEDANHTCSSGLHVCSFSYLPHFAHDNGHVMICKVSPADVVAIPADYNNAKMRVARYQVIGEVENYYRDHRDVLGDMGRAGEVKEPGFTVYDQDGNEIGSFFTLEEAKRQAQAAYDDILRRDVLVQDEEGYVVWTVDEDGGR